MGGRGSDFKEIDNLNYNEKKAIMSYFSSDSYKLNEKLYLHLDLNNSDKEMIENFDKALNKMPFIKEKTLVRDMSFLFKEQKEKYLKQIEVGTIILNDAYWSATTDPEYQDIPDVRFVIHNAKKAKDMSQVEEKGENEVIYPRGSRFEIISKKPLQKYGEHDILLVELKEL